MSREWKPGDVALVTAYANPKIALVRPRREAIDLLEFAYVEGGYDIAGDAGVPARPLIVIDPEDRELTGGVRQLCLALMEGGWAAPSDSPSETITATQAALRSLLEPSIPEPMLIGAVISDKRGTKYVRVSVAGDGCMGGKEWQRVGGNINAVRNFGWADLDVAEVLYGGWTPDASGGAS